MWWSETRAPQPHLKPWRSSQSQAGETVKHSPTRYRDRGCKLTACYELSTSKAPLHQPLRPRCEVVPQHGAPHIQFGTVEAACAGPASGEPEALKGLR
eukprot:2220347-Alexandrium_andersonii.AAC.1